MRPPTGAVLLFSLFGCIFAVEGNLLLQLALWPFNVQAHWIVVTLVSLAFFYLGVVVASLMIMASRNTTKTDDREVAAVAGQRAGRTAVEPSHSVARVSSGKATRPRPADTQTRTAPMVDAPP